MKIWKVKIDELVYELKNLFPGRWDSREVWGLVECVQNNVCTTLPLEGDHFFETFGHSAITRLPYSTIVVRMKSGEYITIGIGLGGKLNEKGGKQVVEFLFIDVSEVEIKEGYGGLLCVT